MEYNEFLKKKQFENVLSGFDVEHEELHSTLFDFQKDIVKWALKKGKAAIFAGTGLGKTLMQLEWARQIYERTGNNVLILAPLAVASQTVREATKIDLSVTHIRQDKTVTDGINITNYEQLHNIDLTNIGAVVLDESSILKNFTGKVRTQIITTFKDTPYKLACTATPAPNDHMELGNHSDFLGVMSGYEMLSMFFINDFKEKQWRLKGHATNDFWQWVSSWAVMITKPSDLGYEDGAYDLPPLKMKEVIIPSEATDSLFPEIAQTLSERRQARRDSLQDRVEKAAEIVNATNEQFLIWCDLNDESEQLTKLIDGAVEVKGSDKVEHKENSMLDFADGSIKRLVSKPSIAGVGMNFQSCNNMVFVGLSDSFEQVFQAIRRSWRFGQDKQVNVYIVISEKEGTVLNNIKRKEEEFNKMIDGMIVHTKDITKENIQSTTKEIMTYYATEETKLPNFIQGA